MTVFLCVACGTSFPAADDPPDRCAICEDERQFVPATGQAWISREALAESHRNAWGQAEPGLLSVQTVPAFAINQRAFLLMTPAGNVLWDCLALLDPATEALVRGLGGLAAIVISHPHFYAAMQDWAAAFAAPIHLHALDADWVMRPSSWVRMWDGAVLEVLPGVTAIHVGGHFPGSSVLHWAAGAEGAGVLLAGDTVQVTPGARRVSFMSSYPNLMPLPAAAVRRIAAVLAPWHYDRIYGAFAGTDLMRGAPAIVEKSAARYVALLQGPAEHPSQQER